MTEFQTTTLTNYIVSKILRKNIAKIVTNSENGKLSEVKTRLTEEVSARLCILPNDSITFNEFVSAIEGQIQIEDYIN